MTDPPPPAPAASEYDRHYESGGFGYEERRDHWLAWAGRNYVEAFGLHRGRLLDVGCGDGFWTSIFTELGFEATGVDRSRGGIEAARSRYPGSRFLEADADEPLPFEAASFDVVFCRAISHLGEPDLQSERVTSLVGRLMTLVAPDGVLLASYHTLRDGGVVHGRTYHPISALVRLLEGAGDPYRVELVGNYVQIGVGHRGGPAHPAGPAAGPGSAERSRPTSGPVQSVRRLVGRVVRRR